MAWRNETDRWATWNERTEFSKGRPCEGKESFRNERQALAKLVEIREHKGHRDRLPVRVYFCDGLPTPDHDGVPGHAGGCFSYHLTSAPDKKGTNGADFSLDY